MIGTLGISSVTAAVFLIMVFSFLVFYLVIIKGAQGLHVTGNSRRGSGYSGDIQHDINKL
ncbi:MAG: hypothetical protein LUF90_05895 [Rikenellaceae bacterium]|nr:hypothetical protein [Rikenellaceae bacterium]